jgi:hypothetical protein
MKIKIGTIAKADIIDVDACHKTEEESREICMRELAKKQNMQHLGRRLKRRGRGANVGYVIPTEYVDNRMPDTLELTTPEIRKIVSRMDRIHWWELEETRQELEDFEFDYVVFSGLPGYGKEFVCMWDEETDTPYVITPTYELWQLDPDTYGIVDIYQDEIVRNCYIRIKKDMEDGVTNRPLHRDRVQWAFESHLKGRRG